MSLHREEKRKNYKVMETFGCLGIVSKYVNELIYWMTIQGHM